MMVLYYIYFGIGLIGLTVIAWGAIVSFLKFVAIESKLASG